MPANDEASLKGKGADIMLPGRGNPFQPVQPPNEPAEAAALSFSIPTAPVLEGTPDLSPEDLARLFPDAAPPSAAPESAELPEWANFAAEAASEPVSFGLSAETADEAALAEMLNNPTAAWANFQEPEPSAPEAVAFGISAEPETSDAAVEELLNNPAPAWANFQAEAEPDPGAMSFGISSMMNEPIPPELIASETMPDLPGEVEGDPASASFAVSGADLAAFGAIMHAEDSAASVTSSAPTGPTSEVWTPGETGAPAASSSTSVASTGPALVSSLPTSNRLAAASRPTGVSFEPSELGPQARPFTRPADLPEDAALVKLLVTDDRMIQTWAEIDALENDIAITPKLSQGVAEEMFARLATARNRMMSGRRHIEEAEQEIAAVKYRFARVRRTQGFEEPRALFSYLLFMLVLAGVGLFVTLGLQSFSAPGDFSVAMLLSTAFTGGLGGVAGGMYALLTHVSNKKDYDPEYALWYYIYPIIGVLLGALIYIVVKLGLFQIGNSEPLTVYVLAPLVGFKQDLAFKWINNWLKQVMPSEGSSK